MWWHGRLLRLPFYLKITDEDEDRGGYSSGGALAITSILNRIVAYQIAKSRHLKFQWRDVKRQNQEWQISIKKTCFYL